MPDLSDETRARLIFDRLIAQPPPNYDEAIRQFTTAFSIVRAEGEAEGRQQAAALRRAVREAVPTLRALMSKPEGVLVGTVRELTEDLERLTKGE